MLSNNFNLFEELILALNETFIMVSVSLIVSIIIGGLLGLLLFLSSNHLFFKNRVLNGVSGIIINVTRSIPFIILLVLLIPISSAIMHTTIGPAAVIVPLSVSAIAFYARLSEASFSDVNMGVLEAGVASGAKSIEIIIHILIPEALPQLINGITITAISLIGFSAMAGTVGGGGIGNLAIRYGYQRYNTTVMLTCVGVLIIIVQSLQLLGDFSAKQVNKK
ncbi:MULTISPECIES: methionine ABC transporter permease [unclassified Clostridium]|uniref:methionine ABC transporter permease n=1 Tax=unclassified Clostridium TaxID=2614128 RepID=UPI000EC0C780|nr:MULTISPECIES: ABC transporter permease subunit [unclassified Clostridium]HCQ89017.1 methionine ABC transporter permease [Clostridium sp.]